MFYLIFTVIGAAVISKGGGAGREGNIDILILSDLLFLEAEIFEWKPVKVLIFVGH